MTFRAYRDPGEKWHGKFHCRVILRENAWAEPCPEQAARTYVDELGVVFGFCLGHTSEGIIERARLGLLIPGIESAAA